MAKNEQKSKKVTWSELRREYPDVPFEFLLKLAREISLPGLDEEGMEILHLFLKEEDERGKATKAAWKELLREKLKTLAASMMHRELEINVPEGLDMEHVQAYIVYGLLQLASPRTFAGKRTVSQRTIKDFTRRKLGPLFDPVKYDQVESWLIQQGVVNTFKGYKLNTKTKGADVTPEGRAIILEARCLLNKYLPTKQE